MTRFQLPRIARRWRFAAALAAVTALAGGGVLLAAPSNPATASAFHPMVATRVLDTREGTGTPIGQLSTIDVLIPGLPDDATAISVNVTAVDGTQASYATVYPAGAAVRPTTSTVNWNSAGAVANSATVVVNPDHMVRVFNLKGTVNVVIDLLGYYAPSPTGGGAVGPTGPAGPVGPASVVPGPVGPGVYLYASNSTPWTVVRGQVVIFDSVDAMLGGITADVTRSVFTVPVAGVYKVTFGILSEYDSQVDILVDGIAGGLTFGAVGLVMNNGTSVLNLAEGDTISLGNRTSTGDEIGPIPGDIELGSVNVGGTAPEINAWIMIEQLSA